MKQAGFGENFVSQPSQNLFIEDLENKRPLIAGYLYASIAIIITNSISIVVNILYKEAIHPGKLIFPRAVIQIIIALALKSKFNFDPWILFSPFAFLLAFFTMTQTAFYVLALNYLLPSDASVLMMSSPLFAVLVSFILQIEKPDIFEILVIFGAIIGILCIVQPSFLFSKKESLNAVGVFLAILVAISQTSVTFLIRHKLSYLSQIDRIWLSGCGILGSGIICLLMIKVENEVSMISVRNLILFFLFTALGISYQFFNLRVTQFLKISIYLTISYSGLLIVIIYDILMGTFLYDWVKIIGMIILVGSCLFLIHLSFK